MLSRTCLALLSVLAASASQSEPGAPDQPQRLEPGETYLQLMQGGRVLFSSSRARDPDGRARLLVRLRGEPVLAAAKGDRSSARKSADKQRQHVAREQERFRKSLSKLAGAKAELRHSYQQVWNGYALSLPAGLADALRRMPEVAEVYPDLEVQAYDDESNTVIGAPQVWANPGLTGKGQVIAVIDTGIDYSHPALGGAFGAQHKVIGGIDLVNADADPMDDHGHGTHVAGIAAGSGPLKGVAPDARLLAVKVLDRRGSGLLSGVIAGIEWAVDPDRNPATDDSADVINLSLGGPGDANSPISQAANAAMAAGIVVVAAAGNDGPAAESVGSPGTASEIITVGATDNADRLADFSSRGPVTSGSGVKPELTAPGVGIDSAAPGNTHQRLSGTSMATPHVAGAAALLRELHPAWSSSQLKSALVNSARDLGLRVWEQGAGRLDLPQAAAQTLSAEPSTVDFGLVDLSQAQWTSSRRIRLTNHGSATETYTLATRGELGPGIHLELVPEQIQLSPGQQTELEIRLQVDNTQTPAPTEALNTVSGGIMISSANQRLKLPFAALRTPVLELELGDNVWFVNAQDSTGKLYEKIEPGTHASLLLPPERYDLQVVYLRSDEFGEPRFDVVQREGIEVRTRTELSLNADEAIHPLTLDLKDSHGKALARPTYSDISLQKKSTGVGLWLLGDVGQGSVRFSPVSADYALQGFVLQKTADDPRSFYQTPFHFEGLSAAPTLSVPAEAYREVNYRFHPPVENRRLPLWLGSLRRFDGGSFGIQISCRDRVQSLLVPDCMLDNPDRLSIHYAPSPAALADTFLWVTAANTARGTPGYAYFQPPLFQVTADGRLMANRHNAVYHPAAEPQADGTVNLGLGQAHPYWIGRFANSAGTIRVEHFENSKSFFLDTSGGHFGTGALSMRIERPDGSVLEESIPQNYHGAIPWDWTRTTQPGLQHFSMDSPRYRLQGREGRGRVEARFDTRPEFADADPPSIHRMELRSGERLTGTMHRHARNSLSFTLTDPQGPYEASLEWQREGETTWTNQPWTRDGDRFEAVLPRNLPEGFYSARLTATDSKGNQLRYSLEPAFFITEQRDGDGDEVLDAQDAFPADAKEWRDTDGDGIGDIAETDDDADGMPDAFERRYDFDPRDPADAPQDADGDGASNLDEYRQHTDPRDPASRPNRAPRALIAALPDQQLLSWHAVALELSAYFEDPDQDPLTYRSEGLPEGLRIEGSRIVGALTGALRASATLKANDGRYDSEPVSVNFIVAEDSPPLAVGRMADQELAPGQAFALDAAPYFRDPDGESLSFSATGLPMGLNIDAQGLISGKARRRGEYEVQITATAGLRSARQDLRMSVVGNQPPEQLNELPERAFRRQRLALFGLAGYFEDPDGDSLQFSARGLPPGLSLSAQGTLRGLASVAGDYPVTVLVSDGQSQLEANWRITILP